MDPNDADAYTIRGNAYRRLGEKAKADYEKALRIDPDNELAKENLAMLEWR